MRFQFATNQQPVTGELRKKKGFLWFPLTINGEMRWLEQAKWIEKYVDAGCHDPICGYVPTPGWVAVYWIEND